MFVGMDVHQHSIDLTVAEGGHDGPIRHFASIDEGDARVSRLTEQIRALLSAWRWREVVEALQALRGVSLIVAVTVVADVGDLTRFTPRELMAFLGLVPAEHSSGARRRQGAITKTNAEYVDGSRITLLDMDMNALLADEAAIKRLTGKLRPGASFSEVKPLLKDIKGIRIDGPSITVQFK